MTYQLLGVDEARAFLRHVPVSARANLRREITQVAGPLTAKIRSNAAWSSRIPGAVKIRPSTTSGVTIYVDSRAAPHARPLERGNSGRGTVNLHPVFGTDRWVSQPPRPFFFPAVRQAAPAVRVAVQKAITDTLRRD